MSDETQYEQIRRLLGVPWGWRLRPIAHKEGYWKLTATAPRPPAKCGELDCGHRSMEVTAPTLPLAVARMAARVRFHRGGG